MAVHNTTADKLKKTLDLGGFPMPSIAVTKTGIVHSNFGEITLVFGRETVDPKADKRNKVYSADAWTPTVPRTEYEANAKVQARVSEKLRALQGRIPADYRGYLAQYTRLDDLLNRYGGQEGVIEKALTDSVMRAAYVADMGGDTSMEKKTTTEGGVSAARADKYRQTLELFDGDVDKMTRTPLSQIRDMPGIGDIWSSFVTRTADRLSGVIAKTADFARGKLDARTVEVSDTTATNDKIDRQIDEGEYRTWLNDLFDGAVGSEGIYNNKGLYTPSGNRRSFAATHYPVTVENIVKAMAGQNGGNSKNVGGFYGIKTLRGATAETFKSVDEMHKRSERLQNRTQEEADALTNALNTRLNDIIGDIVGVTEGTYNSLMKMDQAGEILTEIAETKYSAQSIRDTLAKYQMPVSEELAERIKALLDDTREMPVNLYEAKPQRAVGFDEIRAAIVPNDMDADLRARLGKVTGQILTYPAGDETARMRIRDGIEGVKFSLKNSRSGDRAPVQSQEKTFTNLFHALNIQYTKGAEGFAARDGRTAYGNETAGTVHATAVQGAAELSAQLARQLNYKLHLDEIPDLMKTLVPNMMARSDMIMATPAEQREMALAEYTRLWLYNRDAAVDLGGEMFTLNFEERLRGRGYLRAMQTAQAELTRYINAPENVRSTSMVDMDAVEQNAQRAGLGRWLETRIADKTYAVQRLTDLMINQLGEDAVDAADDPRTLMLANANKGQNYVDTLVEDRLIDPEGNTIGNSSLGSILHRVGKNKETQREFAAYWLSLHKLDRLTAHQRTLNLDLDPDVIAANTKLAEAQEALDRYAGSLGEVPAQTDRLRQAVNEAAAEVTQAISNAREHAMELDSQRRVSIESRAEVEAAIAQYEEAHPDWREIVDDATAWYDLFMRAWVVNTGMLSEADYETMHEMYPHYIPTYRTLYQNAEAARNGGGTNGANSGIKRAVGSDLDVFNPVVGLVENMQHLVMNYKSAEVGRALVNAIRRTTDNGFIAEIVGTPESAVLYKDYYDTPLREHLANLGRDGIHMTGSNIMTVMDTDGRPVSLQINDPLLADVLLHTQPQDMGRVFNAARRVKALITNTATALSLGFSVPNALGDFGTAIMTGSFAGNPVTGALKWVASFGEYFANHAADSLNSNAGTHIRTGKTYDAYKLFASLNSRYNLREHDARRELQTKLYGGSVTFAEVRDAFERSPILGVGSALTALPKLLIRNPIEWINDVIENTTRFAEFKYGKHRTNSYAARLEAGRAAREVTTDFSRSGTSRSLAMAKSMIPFFGATIAGVNKSIMLIAGRENRGRRGAILAKAGEIAMIGMAAALMRNTRWTDDDREFYDLLQDDYKMKYYILPLDGNGHFLRIKKSQDMIYLLADQMGEFLANYMTGADGGELGDLVGSMGALLASTTDITTIADPILNVKTNTTWYGTPIENYAMQQKPTADRYNADTSPLWRGLSNAAQALGMDVSPLDVEYLARQYLGSYGTLLGKAMREATTGTLTAQRFGSLVWDRLFGRLTIDGAVSNQASNIFYEGYDVIAQIARTDTPDGTSSLLKYDLSESEMQDAIADAKLLLKDLNRVKQDINALWDEYSDTEDEDARREIRTEIMRVCVEANASISDYRAAYCYASASEQAVLNTLDLFTHSKAKIEE